MESTYTIRAYDAPGSIIGETTFAADELRPQILAALQDARPDATTGYLLGDVDVIAGYLADHGDANYTADHGAGFDVIDVTRVPYVADVDGHYYGERVDTFETRRTAPGFYVADAYAPTFADAIIAGPFPTPRAAAADRAERNIADDCEIVRVAEPTCAAVSR